MLVRYAVSAAIGAVIFTLVGYFAYAAEADAIGAIDLGYWPSRPERWWPWPFVGVLTGLGVQFLRART